MFFKQKCEKMAEYKRIELPLLKFKTINLFKRVIGVVVILGAHPLVNAQQITHCQLFQDTSYKYIDDTTAVIGTFTHVFGNMNFSEFPVIGYSKSRLVVHNERHQKAFIVNPVSSLEFPYFTASGDVKITKNAYVLPLNTSYLGWDRNVYYAGFLYFLDSTFWSERVPSHIVFAKGEPIYNSRSTQIVGVAPVNNSKYMVVMQAGKQSDNNTASGFPYVQFAFLSTSSLTSSLCDVVFRVDTSPIVQYSIFTNLTAWRDKWATLGFIRMWNDSFYLAIALGDTSSCSPQKFVYIGVDGWISWTTTPDIAFLNDSLLVIATNVVDTTTFFGVPVLITLNLNTGNVQNAYVINEPIANRPFGYYNSSVSIENINDSLLVGVLSKPTTLLFLDNTGNITSSYAFGPQDFDTIPSQQLIPAVDYYYNLINVRNYNTKIVFEPSSQELRVFIPYFAENDNYPYYQMRNFGFYASFSLQHPYKPQQTSQCCLFEPTTLDIQPIRAYTIDTFNLIQQENNLSLTWTPAGSDTLVSMNTLREIYCNQTFQIVSVEHTNWQGNQPIIYINDRTLHIILPDGIKQATATLYDLQGRPIIPQTQLQTGLNTITLNSLAKGVYVVKVSTKHGFTLAKIMIQ